MIDSPSSHTDASAGRLRRAIPLAVLAAMCAVGCRTPSATPSADELLQPLPERAPAWVPTDADRVAARLTEAALADAVTSLEPALHDLEAACASDPDRNEKLMPLAVDMVDSTLSDAIAYREASKDLLGDYSADPILESRIEESLDNAPLRLARLRVRDHYEILWARTFNAVSEPIGRSVIMGGAVAPVVLANSAVHYLASFAGREKLSLQKRQALALRKQFLARHPDARQAEKVADAVERDQRRLDQTYRDRLVKNSKTALGNGRPRAAYAHARRALTHMPDDGEALALLQESEEAVEWQRIGRARSLEATTQPLPELEDPLAAQLTTQLLVPGHSLLEPATEFAETHRRGPLAGEADYLLALGLYEAQYEDASWRRLEALGLQPVTASPMTRHAGALVASPWQNPYRAFRSQLGSGQRKRLAWYFLDSWALRPRYTNLPPLVAYAVDSLSIAQTVLVAPFRWIMSPFQSQPQFQRSTALSAYHYLALHPDGAHAQELVTWLYDFEKKRKNWSAALRLADLMSGFDPEERTKLVEKAAGQRIEFANRTKLRDRRTSMLRDVAREYPDAHAGHQAGTQVRAEFEEASPQRIRMTRDFLLENPRVAGAFGLGLQPSLVDGKIFNGELHPEGVTMLGGRTLEFALVAKKGDEEAPPERLRKSISGTRLARLVTLLDETALTNTRIDRDELLDADAGRDYYFERARLGLTEEPDVRATAQSNYVYQSLKERYGVVRGRDSILPFDLVLRGNLSDMSLGAFPRWRYPRETPDAFLYR